MTIEPYHPQSRPRLLARVLAVLVWRKIKCRRYFCTWPATEEGWFCDRHDPHRAVYIARSEADDD